MPKGTNFLLRYQQWIIALAVIVFLAFAILFHPQPLEYWLEFWWMVPIFFILSLIANTAGISGAALFVPFFILIFPLIAGYELSAVETVRLGLITESFGLSSSALAFFAFRQIDVKLATKIIMWVLPFVTIGALVTVFIPDSILYIVVAIMLMVAALLLIYGKEISRKRKREDARDTVSYGTDDPSAVVVERSDKEGRKYSYCITKTGNRERNFAYSLGGFFQGAAGFGIGELGVISMILTHIPVRIAIGTSHLIVAVAAITASLIHVFFVVNESGTSSIPWNILVMTVPTVVIAGQLSPYVASKIPVKYLQSFVTILFVVIAGALVLLATN